MALKKGDQKGGQKGGPQIVFQRLALKKGVQTWHKKTISNGVQKFNLKKVFKNLGPKKRV